MRKTPVLICLLSTVLFSTIMAHGAARHEHFDYDSEDIDSLSLLDSETNFDPTGATYSYDSNSMFRYFSNLQGNMGKNIKGSCGYVAIGMLLSYYDSFFDDDIIPEAYDINNVELATVSFAARKESPGTFCEDIATSNRYATNEYYNNLLYSYRGFSLHAKLLVRSNYQYGTNYSSRQTIINDYLTNVAGYSSYSLSGINRGAYFYSGQTQTTIDYYSNEVKSYIITQVSSGIPVIVGICNSSFTSHHAAVAYAYDQTTGKIYTNMGWGYGSSARLLPSNNGYCYFKSALTFTPTGSHVHSDNYVFRSSFGEQYNYYTCGCSYTSHVHDYSFSFVSMNNAKHKAFCSCGNKQIQPHSLIDGVCVCGYELNPILLCSEGDDEDE